jgi:hypothetical protein
MKTAVTGFLHLYGEFCRISRDPQQLGRESHDTLFRILKHIKAFPECRADLVTCFVKLVEDLKDYTSDVSYGWGVIPFCMRELQWPEVKEAIERELQIVMDPEIVRFLNRIHSAYEPFWEDETSFLYYVEKAEKEGRLLSHRPPKTGWKERLFRRRKPLGNY